VASLNKVMLIGNAGKDAELRYTANGTAQAQFSLAVNFRRRGTSGEFEDATEWFNIVLFREQAEKLSQYITKGKALYVEGRLQTRTWDDDQGQKHYRTEVVANQIQLLGSREGGGGGGGDWGEGATRAAGGRTGSSGPRRGSPGEEIDVDDLPFE
jgi:single-strand DNA-binding protein